MRMIAILATYNEERFLPACLDHLIRHGVEVYICDNESVDRTLAIAERYVRRGVIGIETISRHGTFHLSDILRRKQELAAILDADWFIHLDADEIRLPPDANETLLQSIAEADKQGYNAVHFQEFTFVPTQEAPDHDHPFFQQTMRWYYPFGRSFPARLTAWKKQSGPVDLVSSGGHVVAFPGVRMYPVSFPMRHYLFLSVSHGVRKYLSRRYDEDGLQRGWHRWRSTLRVDSFQLPPQAALRYYSSDQALDASEPWTQHYGEKRATRRQSEISGAICEVQEAAC